MPRRRDTVDKAEQALDGKALLWLGEMAMQQRASELPDAGELRSANAPVYRPPPVETEGFMQAVQRDMDWDQRVRDLPSEEEVKKRRAEGPPRFDAGLAEEQALRFEPAEVGVCAETEALLREQEEIMLQSRSSGPLNPEVVRALFEQSLAKSGMADVAPAGQTFLLGATPNFAPYVAAHEEEGIPWDYAPAAGGSG